MFHVYILRNTQGKIYIGQTNDLSRRLMEHNEIGTGYTSKYRPWNIIHSETFESRKDAMHREKYLKSGVGRRWLRDNLRV